MSTAPQPLRPKNGDSRQTTSSAHFDLPTVSTPVLDRPQPVQRDRRPGGTALDVIEQQFAPETPAPRNWRELIQRYVGIDLGPGRTAAYENALRDQVRTAVGGAYPIAVLNLKGGVGKTAVVEALGSTFASVRNDRVIAVDLDAGDLADRHGRRHDLTLADLIHDNRVARYADVRAHTFMNSSGLEVLGLPDPAHSNFCISRQDFVKAFSILRSHYSVVLIDCPKTLNSGVMDAVLLESRALVVVTSTSIDSIQKTSATLEWLSRNGYRKLVAATVLAVNHVERTKLSPLAAKQLEQLSAQVAATVVLPFDGHVHQGREIGLDLLSKVSRRSFLELAAALARLLPCRQPAGL
ncbi:MinD/ParA family protein [Mycobacterium asiaticum]|uniref:MinD/ParA family ATP-binding protein n=1 Tax=Mycobacterium asiaticum TaxID=1790 RepID=UPI001E35DD14|nr:MinD/ParA family protein [Mycobacterium asiaticum]